ncbi:DUF4064 domain-containing protein [Bacillus safensis]|uniref:DUF4064 domain-containing protein n=1 Tax=Bacillus safensis TaxID=561879 RepID=UPI000B4369BA|nr:DUF4064 domain-containing protein [Bacillus safensis]PAK32506.1 DUF4064 domain-containing protein [Bacillus safensis]UDB51947.1 DUF4064 domain-containing protein [Bacillus safensis]USD83073.1 DUF4064 domain-containing protein [Bacillus safensis]
MNRTLEKSFTIIGIVLFVFLLIGSFMFYESTKNNNDTFKLVQDFIEEENIKDIAPEQVIDLISNGSLYIVVLSVLSILAGVISLFLLKNNTRSAGILLITTSILSSILTIFLGILGGITYLIAGIVIVSKGKKVENESYQSFK